MSNVLYPLGKKAILDGDVDLLSDTIKAALVDTGTTAYSAAHDFYNDISGAVVGTPVTLGTKSTTGGVFDAADITFTAVSGATCEAVVIYKDTGTPSTSQLLAFIDTATGLPATPSGGDINVNWNASGIFAI
jgi:hypothetical protein